MRTDGELVAESLAGGHGAYRELVARHERSVRAAAWSVLRDHHAAEDVAQEALVTAYRKLASLRRGEFFAAWVCRIARREAQRELRRRKRERQALADQPPRQPDRDEAGQQELMRAVVALPPRMRALVMMAYFEDRSAAEIAHLQDCPVGTVTKLLSRARRRLGRHIREQQK